VRSAEVKRECPGGASPRNRLHTNRFGSRIVPSFMQRACTNFDNGLQQTRGTIGNMNSQHDDAKR